MSIAEILLSLMVLLTFFRFVMDCIKVQTMRGNGYDGQTEKDHNRSRGTLASKACALSDRPRVESTSAQPDTRSL